MSKFWVFFSNLELLWIKLQLIILCVCGSYVAHGLHTASVLHYLLKFVQIHVHWVKCNLTISSSTMLFIFAFNHSQHWDIFKWAPSGGQAIGTLTSASILPINIQGGFPFSINCLILLESMGPLKVFQHNSKAMILWHSALFFMFQLYTYNNFQPRYLVIFKRGHWFYKANSCK